MEYTTSTWRKVNAGFSFVMFIVFFGIALYAEMRNGSPEIVDGVIIGYWHVAPLVRAILWVLCAMFGVMGVLVLVWPGPARGSIEYKAAKGAKVALQCPRCAAPVGKDYMACPSCTLPLLQLCPSCGERLPASYNACPRCGNVIRNPKAP